MEFNLTKFDWTAVSALATLGTLIFLWHQIRLMTAQVTQASEQLRLAMEQMTEAATRAEEQRHESVQPDLVITRWYCHSGVDEDGNLVLTKDGKTIEVTLHLRNDGFGAAKHIQVRSDNPTVRTLKASASIPAGSEGCVVFEIQRPASGTLWLTYTGVFGRTYQCEYQTMETDDGLVIYLAVEGEPTRLLL